MIVTSYLEDSTDGFTPREGPNLLLTYNTKAKNHQYDSLEKCEKFGGSGGGGVWGFTNDGLTSPAQNQICVFASTNNTADAWSGSDKDQFCFRIFKNKIFQEGAKGYVYMMTGEDHTALTPLLIK